MPFSKYTPAQKRLASMYGDKKKITRGDIIMASKAKKKMRRKLLSVARKLEKASKAHAGQAKILKGLANGKSKKRR